MIRAYSLVISLLLATYGALGLWISRTSNHPLQEPFCAAGLCPLEFSPSRLYELHYQARAGRTREAIREFRREIEADPASPHAWADLAETLAIGRQGRLAAYSIEQAVSAAPNSPAVLMRAVNASLSIADNQRAIRLLSRILQNPGNREFFPAVFLTYSRLRIPIESVLANGFPRTTRAAAPLLEFLFAAGRVPDVMIAWGWMVRNNLQTDTLASEYVRFLLSTGHETDAADAWAELNRSRTPEYRKANWISNGSFEQAPRPGPLDWQIEPDANVEITRSTALAHDGERSLALQFGGLENTNFQGVHQETALAPGKWRLRAFIKTSGITTDQGLGLRIRDAAQVRNLDVRTGALTGSHDWTLLERVFEVRPQTRLVRVELFRDPSSRFDNKIEGRAWIDSVELVPAR